MNLNRAWLISPAAPALLLLFGLVFGYAIAHIAGVTWSPTATRIYYGGLFIWGGVVLVSRRQMLRRLGPLDYLFLVFIVLVVTSLAMQHQGNVVLVYYEMLLPFLVLLPYCLGRLTVKLDLAAIMWALPGLGVLILVFTAVDFWWIPSNLSPHARRIFFGINHSPLLIAMLVSVAMLALAHRLVKKPDVEKTELGWRMVLAWCLFGGMVMASVFIAARGALIASTLALVLMMAVMRGRWLSKAVLLGYFVCVAFASFYSLPTPQAQFYANLQSMGDEARIKNDPRCKPIVDGVNSIAIRRILYQEAIDLSLQHLQLGVGATNFGHHSCGGVGAYPHSSILQAFAELGVLGGGALLTLFVYSFASLVYASLLCKSNNNDHVFWLGLIAFFGLADQIYGNYFMSVGPFFLFGVVAGICMRSGKSFVVMSYVKSLP